MHDYFSQFLLGKNPVSSFLGDPQIIANTTSTLSSFKVHLLWSAATIGLAFLAWKVGKWHAGYEFMVKQQAASVKINP